MGILLNVFSSEWEGSVQRIVTGLRTARAAPACKKRLEAVAAGTGGGRVKLSLRRRPAGMRAGGE